jgi:hypothetical protein
MRILLRWLLAGMGLLVLVGGYIFWNNNRPVAAPDHGQLEAARERSIQWLISNREKILEDNNSMLWLMVQEAADISGDERLQGLFASYRQRHIETNPNSLWRPLFYPKTWVPVRYQDIARFPDYNQYFIYAITCDRDLAKVPAIAAQNTPEFCDRHPLRPACVTHQMMGLLLLKRSECGDMKQLDETIRTLQQRIRKQLIWDPRVVDVYMQRVLMLVQSGAGDLVKPVWLQRLLDAQQTDGGWSGFMPLVPVGKHRYIGISRLPGIGTLRSNFHMTAQGVLLFSLLTHPHTHR